MDKESCPCDLKCNEKDVCQCGPRCICLIYGGVDYGWICVSFVFLNWRNKMDSKNWESLKRDTQQSYEYWHKQMIADPDSNWISGQVHALSSVLHTIQCLEEDISAVTAKYICPCHVCTYSRKRKETEHV